MTDRDWLEHELQSLAARARARRRTGREVGPAVAAYLAEHPDASANAVHREVGGRRQDVLRAVRAHKNRFPGARNPQNAGPA